MQERCFMILNLLREADGYVTADALAKSLHICSRSIRNDMTQLKLQLERLGINGLSSKTRNGYRLELTDEQWKRVDACFSVDKTQLSFSRTEGGKYIVLELLLKGNGVNLRQLKQETYSSGREAMEYLNDARQWLRVHNILLHRRKGQGIFIDGERHWVRIAQWNLYRECMHTSGAKMDNESICRFFEIGHNYNLEYIPERLEKKYDLYFSAESYIRIIFLLTAVLMDYRRKFSYHFPMGEFRSTKMERSMSIDCIQWMQEMCGVCLDLEEQNFFKFIIASSEIMHFHSRQRQVEFEYEHKPVQQLVNNMIAVVGSVLRTDISTDRVLIQSWEQYLCAMSTESRYGVLRSRGDMEIPQGSAPIRLACWLSSQLLEEKLGMVTTEREISCLAQHVEAAVRRRRRNIKAILVSNENPGAVRLLAERLHNAFPDLQFIENCHSYHAEQIIRNQNVDLVISTEEMPAMPRSKLVKIEAALASADIAAISNHIRQYFQEDVPGLTGLQPIQTLFWEELVLFLSGNESKNEILHQMASVLASHGAVDKMFIKSVLQREKISSTYFEHGVAIPHGFPEFVRQPMVAVVFLKKPVRWSGSDWADVIFMMAVNMDSQFEVQKRIISFYRGLIQTLSQPEALQRFKRLTTPRGVVDAINTMIAPNTYK